MYSSLLCFLVTMLFTMCYVLAPLVKNLSLSLRFFAPRCTVSADSRLGAEHLWQGLTSQQVLDPVSVLPAWPGAVGPKLPVCG